MKMTYLVVAVSLFFTILTGKCDKTNAGNPLVRHWAVEPMSDIMRLPDKEPEDGDLGGVVRIRMAQDEYEPGSFVVQAAGDLGKVKFELSEFKTAEGRVLPADTLDLKFLKVWYQNQNGWFCYFGDTGSMKLVPELLVNDEDLIRVDTATTNNFARLVEADGVVHEQWINPPREIDTRAPGFFVHGDKRVFMPMKADFRDAKKLQPVALPKGECKQFFLTAHAAKDTPAGLYRGIVEMKDGGGLRIGAIPVEIMVLPFVLPRPKTWVRPSEDYLNCSYSYISFDLIGRLNGDNHELTLRQYEAILRDQVAHGQDMHWVRGRPNPMKPEANYEALWTIDAMKRVGMRTDVIVMDANPTLPRRKKGEAPYAYEDYYTNGVKTVREIDAVLGHHNVYTGFGDEPSSRWLVDNRLIFESFQDAGLKFILAGWNQIFAKNPHAMDWQNVGTEPNQGEIPAKWNVLGMKTGWYGHLHVGPENPAVCRRQYGLVPYFTGYTANCNYAHHLGGYNDDTVTYRQMNFVYGTGDGVLDTIQWEGFREGIDDIRYATLLRRMADSAKDSTDGVTRRTALKSLAYMVNVSAASDNLTAVRSRLVDYILELKKRGVAIPEDRPRVACRDFEVPEPPHNAVQSGQNVRSLYFRGDFAGAWQAFMDQWRKGKFRPQRIDDVRIALYAAKATGHLDTVRQIVSNVVESVTHYKASGVYEICFAARALEADAKSRDVAARLSELEAGLAAGIAPKERLAVIERTASAALFGGKETLARALWACRMALLKDEKRRHYAVKWVDKQILGPESWDGLTVDEAPLDRKYQGALDFLVTDISTGDRGVDASNAQGGTSATLSFAAVADDWGLHFRFTDRTEDALKIGYGELSDGCYEMYIAPSADMPHTALLWDVRADGKCKAWNCGYDCEDFRRFEEDDLTKLRSCIVCRENRVEGYLDLSWKCWYSRLPANGSSYEFEVLRWGKHSGAWNGTKSIHGRSTWGRLDFDLTDVQRGQIYRRLLFWAKNSGWRAAANYWKDSELGDTDFYATAVKPREDTLDERLRGVTTEVDPKTALSIGPALVRDLVNFKYDVDADRVRYVAERGAE